MNRSEREAFTRLARIYARVDLENARRECRACGQCCRFESFGHRLYATYLEAAYLVAVCGPPQRAFTPDRCPWQRRRRCTARAGRVLGCRTFFCEAGGGFSAELHESALADIRRLGERLGMPAEYMPLERQVERLAPARNTGRACAK